MPVTKYQFTISTQTANGEVDATALIYEIGLALPAPAPAINNVDVNCEPDKLDVYMDAALSAPDEATLDATVAAHQGVSMPAISSPAAGGVSTSFIYRPGSGLKGPVVYDDWALIMERLRVSRLDANAAGGYEIQVDDSHVSPAIIPAAGSPHDMRDTKLSGVSKRLVQCKLANGITFTGLRHIDNIFIDMLSVAPSPVPCTDFVAGFDQIIVEGSASVSCATGGIPLWDTTLAGAGLFMYVTVRTKATLSNNPSGGRPVFHAGFAGQTILFKLSSGGGIWRNGVSSVVGALGTADLDVTTLWGAHPSWLGTLTENVQALGPAGNVKPVPPAAAGIANTSLTATDSLVRCNVAGGGFTQLLPLLPQASNVKLTCRRIVVREESGTAGLLVGRSGTNTINGATTPVAVPAGGSITFIADGVSNWVVESVCNPAGAADAQDTLVFQPGGTGVGPVIFSSWPTLMARLALLRTQAGGNGTKPIVIQFDDSITTPAVIPAGGPYDMRDVIWEGGDLAANSFVAVSLAAGSSFSKLRRFRRNLQVRNLNTAAPADTSLANNEWISLEDGAVVASITGSQPMWSATGLTSGHIAYLVLRDGSGIDTFPAGHLGPVLNFPVSGTMLFMLSDLGSSLPSSGIVGAVGTTLIPAVQNMKSYPINNFPTWLGTISPVRLDGPTTYRPNPMLVAPSTAAVTMTRGDWMRLNAAAGVISQPLLNISGNYPSPGATTIVSESSGVNGISLVPHATDTINGVATPFLVPAGGAVMLVNDGISDYKVIGVFNPVTPPAPVQQLVLMASPAMNINDANWYGPPSLAGGVLNFEWSTALGISPDEFASGFWVPFDANVLSCEVALLRRSSSPTSYMRLMRQRKVWNTATVANQLLGTQKTMSSGTQDQYRLYTYSMAGVSSVLKDDMIIPIFQTDLASLDYHHISLRIVLEAV